MWTSQVKVYGTTFWVLLALHQSLAFNTFNVQSKTSFLQSTGNTFRYNLQNVPSSQNPHLLKAVLDPVDTMTFFQSSQEWLSSSTSFLADAAATVEEAAQDPNLWQQYLNFVEGCFKGLHTGLQGVGVNSWGVTIATFTLGVKILLFPLNWTQQESAQKMQILAPEAKKIGERVKNKETRNIMTAQLYEQTQVNPLAGCIPALLQIPIFIALYRSILELSAQDLLNEPFLFLPSLAGPVYGERSMSWITDAIFNPTNPPLGWGDTLLYLIIPATLVLSQSVTMKMMTPPADPKDEAAQRTQAILKYLPFLIGYFSLSVPAGLSVYWFINNVFTTATSLGIKAYFKANPPELDFGDFKELLESDAPIAQTFEEALAEARLHELPPRGPRRMA